ncbi:hypothetical protein B9Z55_015715 [Caenorhabditis nigoni]|uniref:Uncharacterized protein n=1 Tax=Caenorhabditis nigoni TaxID=1611254 RepID=A0A2G5UBR3_9PELO|nr:hypothetical protein B9Z55_015715 [Caenorhabditis nigoni]
MRRTTATRSNEAEPSRVGAYLEALAMLTRILVFRIGNDFGSRIQSGWENLSAPNQNGSHLTNAERRRTAGSLRGNSVLMFLYNSRS